MTVFAGGLPMRIRQQKAGRGVIEGRAPERLIEARLEIARWRIALRLTRRSINEQCPGHDDQGEQQGSQNPPRRKWRAPTQSVLRICFIEPNNSTMHQADSYHSERTGPTAKAAVVTGNTSHAPLPDQATKDSPKVNASLPSYQSCVGRIAKIGFLTRDERPFIDHRPESDLKSAGD
jgi:hypothetical protein